MNGGRGGDERMGGRVNERMEGYWREERGPGGWERRYEEGVNGVESERKGLARE